jgi:acyl-CoA reductase-like NAD-dependent aldehyde dehydrogenase
MTSAPAHSVNGAATAVGLPHLPLLRWGATYESLDAVVLTDHRSGEPLARVSQANEGLIRRDLRRAGEAAATLRALPVRERLRICAEAGELFMRASLPLGAAGAMQSPDDYVAALGATSGLPHALCRRNMAKVHTVFTEMPTILNGLMRGLDPAVLDTGLGEQDGIPLRFAPTAPALGVVLPSNSPGVNSIWMPAIALGTPVVLKPGREEPWTPLRIIRSLIAAGCPREAFGFYPTDHAGAGAIIEGCSRSLLFGDERTTRQYRSNPAVQIHGPGRSKIIIGPDEIDRWRDHLDVLVASVVDNGGRSCINVSSILVPARADEIADALARALAPIEPRPAGDERAVLAAHPDVAVATFIDEAIERSIGAGGAEDVTARYREGPRRVESGGAVYLRPTIVHCAGMDHPLANTEFMFPFASVVEVPPDTLLERIGPSLVVTAVTRDPRLIEALVASPLIDRLNIGPIPTTRVDWDQPHEGNLFEFLLARRAIHRGDDW